MAHPQTKTIALPRWPLPLKNDSGETVPAFAIVKISTDAELGDEILYAVEQSAGGDSAQCVFNGPVQIPDGEQGNGTDDYPAVALYDYVDTPVVGEEWGPVAGSWKIKKTGAGFKIVGGVDATATTVHVMRMGGGGGNGDLLFGRTTTPVSAREDWTTLGDGEIQPLAGCVTVVGDPIPLKNPFFSSILENVGVWYKLVGDTAFAVRPDCFPGPTP